MFHPEPFSTHPLTHPSGLAWKMHDILWYFPPQAAAHLIDAGDWQHRQAPHNSKHESCILRANRSPEAGAPNWGSSKVCRAAGVAAAFGKDGDKPASPWGALAWVTPNGIAQSTIWS
jgi:hypothetical protein